ncbi:MAG: hypothetical protein J2P25_04750 [Nocardiopsaceae bacterium]|nr:hypothetical protein [Nocardiopsaceae bacterium]
MYEMYPFTAAGGPFAAGNLGTVDEKAATPAGAAIRSEERDRDFSVALQLALDRRDNGGDARGRPPAAHRR